MSETALEPPKPEEPEPKVVEELEGVLAEPEHLEPEDTQDAKEIPEEETPIEVAEEKEEEPETVIPEQEEGDDKESEIIATEDAQVESEITPETTELEITEPVVSTPELDDASVTGDIELGETGEDELDIESGEAKRMDFDFVPTKDTLTIITNLDVDGLLCAASIKKLINNPQDSVKESEIKDIKNVRMFFSSPPKIFSTLSKSVPDLNKIDDSDFAIGQLYICDLSLHRDTLLGSTIYDSIKWFDHHEINPAEQYDSEIDNLELVIDPTANSSTAVICEYFKIDCEFSSIADEVDAIDVKTDAAKRLHDLIGAIKLKNSGSKLQKALNELAQQIAEDFNVINDEIHNPLIEEYTKWVEEFDKILDTNLQSNEITGHKIGILEVENAAPVFSIYNKLKKHPDGPFDVIAVMIHKYYRLGKDKNNKFKNKKYTKIEFRTHTGKEIIELAKQLGGGGHKFASGTTIHDGFDKEELIKTLESYFNTPQESPENKK